MIAVEEEEKNLDQAQLDLEIIEKVGRGGSKKGSLLSREGCGCVIN